MFVLRSLDEERGGRNGNDFARINIRTCVWWTKTLIIYVLRTIITHHHHANRHVMQKTVRTRHRVLPNTYGHHALKTLNTQ